MTLLAITEPIQAPLRALLEFLGPGTFGLDWAWAIIATTVVVRILLVPLTVKQIHSMQNLQRHAPEMKAIQQKYKGDRQKQNEELMKFYKENRINPAASCLPIVAQIPVFISLFFVLRGFEDTILPRYEGTDLGWLGVLPSITQSANEHWSGYMLLVIYAISQTTATLFMSSQMEKMQRTLLLIMPLAFLFFILNFPAGLVLYWVTTNLWTTGQGIVTRTLMPKPVTPPKRSSRTPPRAERAAPAEASSDGAAEPAPRATPAQPRKVKRKKKKSGRR